MPQLIVSSILILISVFAISALLYEDNYKKRVVLMALWAATSIPIYCSCLIFVIKTQGLV